MAGPIRIGVIVDADSARREFNSTADAADNTGSRMSKLGTLGKAAAIGLAAGAVAAGAAVVSMTKSAIEDEAAQVKLANTLKNVTGATDAQVKSAESWISAQGKAYGVTDDELRPALAKLVTATGSVAKGQKLAALAMDVSAGTGKSLESVTTALQKAQQGSLGGLSKLGIATKDAAGNTLTMKQATQQMADTFGGQAAAQAGTLQGKMDILKVAFDEAKESIGARLIPILTDLAGFIISDVMPAVSSFGAFLDDNRGKVTVFAAVFGVLVTALIAASVAMKIQAAGLLIYNGAMLVVSATTKVWAAGQWLLNAALTANPIGLVVVAIVALVAIIVVAWKNSETFRGIVIGAWNAIKTATGEVFDWIKDKISEVWGFIKGLFLNFTGPGLIIKHWDTIKTATRDAFEAVKTAVRDKLDDVVGFIAGLKERIQAKFTAAVSWLIGEGRQIIGGLISGIGERFSDVGGKLVDLKTNITGKFSEALAWLLGEGRQIIGGLIQGIGERFVDVGSKLVELKTAVQGKFTEAAAWLVGAGKDIIQGLINGIESMISSVKSKLKSLTDLIPDVKGPPARDRKLLRPAGQQIIEGLIRGFEDRFPAVRSTLRELTSDVAGFGGTLDLSSSGGAVAAFDAAVSASASQTIAVRLTAEQVSALQRGREIQADLDVARRAGVRIAT